MKRGYEFRARLWQSISTIAICAAMITVLAGCGGVFHQPKHTGPCTVAYFNGETYTMERANGEVFTMSFPYYRPHLPLGLKLTDVLYEDHDRSQYFVKAVLASGESLERSVAKQQHAAQSFTCPTNATCFMPGTVSYP